MHTDIRQDVGDSRIPTGRQAIQAAVLWGLLFGDIQAAAPLLVWWLPPGTVYALSLILIASVYIGFVVADGRPIVIAVESSIAAIFVVIAAAAITGSAWLLVIGLAGHAFKDLWQHRRQYVPVHAGGALLLHSRPGCSSTHYPCDTRRNAVTALAPGPQRARTTDTVPVCWRPVQRRGRDGRDPLTCSAR